MRERLAFLAGFTSGIPALLLWLAIDPNSPQTLVHRVLPGVSGLLLLFASYRAAKTSREIREFDEAASALRIINASLKKPLPKDASIEQLRDAVVIELSGLEEP